MFIDVNNIIGQLMEDSASEAAITVRHTTGVADYLFAEAPSNVEAPNTTTTFAAIVDPDVSRICCLMRACEEL